MREALRERGLLLNVLAPHLVTPVPFLLPLTEHWQRAYIGAGLALYDSLGGHEGLPRHRHLTQARRAEDRARAARDALVGAIQYYDAKVDDARHTLTVARTAASMGAAVASNARVVGFLREGERVTGVRVRDALGGEEIDVRAREVVNATGVWTDDVQHLVGERGKFKVRASKGVHLVVPRDRMQLDTGLILRTETTRAVRDPVGPALDRRHHRHRLGARQGAPGGVGDRHRLRARARQRGARPAADARGRRGRLRRAAAAADRRVRSRRRQLSREHTVAVPVPGLVAVAGGKYTTYRVMARDAIDAVARGLDRFVPPSATHVTPLLGADGLPGAVEPARAGGARLAACTSRASSTCCAATARGSTTCWR